MGLLFRKKSSSKQYKSNSWHFRAATKILKLLTVRYCHPGGGKERGKRV